MILMRNDHLDETDQVDEQLEDKVPHLDSASKPAVDYVRENGVLKPVPRGTKNSKFRRDPKTGMLTQD